MLFDSFIQLLVFKRKFCYQMDISQVGRYTISPQSLLLLLWNISVKETNSYTINFESDGISVDRQNDRQVSFLQVVHSYGWLQVAHNVAKAQGAPSSLIEKPPLYHPNRPTNTPPLCRALDTFQQLWSWHRSWGSKVTFQNDSHKIILCTKVIYF